ncbi:Armadillo-like helical-containing protein [Dioscorea alata]|uniref:Armadillo-like helical-containing protein n=1 Tax=Dioscorea alata TaxID=55571 RepID=A0ACB7W7N6_DIOAL|nr:Armadillo-like helical-containing protein [Dioscorea alata]
MKEEEEEKLQKSYLTGDEDLRRASQLVDSLISSSYSVRTLPMKWRVIREKLEQLHSGLTVAAGGNQEGSYNSSALAELLRDIVSMAAETQALAHRCSEEGYSGGKLQMRSDLDVIASKIDLQIKRLGEVYASGILTDAQAIIVSRPSAGASREDMRFYVKDLFSRLRIGDSEMRDRAIAALAEALHEDDKYARIVVLETDDGVGLLVRLLDSRAAGFQEEAAEAVSVIAGFDSYKGALITAGVIASLIRVLETGTDVGRSRAARALRKLTENSDNAWSVSAHGGVTALLNICRDAGSGEELITSTSRVLRNLSSVSEIRRFMVEQGAVSIFLNILRSRNKEPFQIQAIEFLHTLASDDEAIKEKVAIDTLCFSSASAMSSLAAHGFLDRILFYVKNGEPSTQELALKAALRLGTSTDETKKTMGDMGFIPALISLLETKSFDVREMAAELLCGLVSVQRNRRRFIQEDYNINRVLQLLTPDDEKSVSKKFLLSILISLTENHSGRRKIAASGYMKNLEKLAETDVVDAKKIVKKLSGNKLRNIFSGLWGS